MPVSLKVKPSKAVKSPTAIIVDRIVELKKKLDAVEPERAEYEALVADLRKQAMEVDPKQVVHFEGTDHQVVFSEASKLRKLIDMTAVKKALGTETFFKVAKVTLADIDKYLTPEEVAPLVKTTDGPRRIDIMEK